MATTNELLQDGIRAVKDGKADKARQILKQVIEQDSRNEMAWLWLSGVVETDERRTACLENVLAINPHNKAAQRGLSALRQKAVAIKPLPVMPSQAQVITTAPAQPRKRWYRQGWFLLLTFLFCTPLWALIVLADPNQGTWAKALAGILLVVYIVFVCPSVMREFIATTSPLPPTPTTSRVTYQITGSAQRASVIYWTADGMEQRTVDLPWKRTFKAQERQIISIVAQNEGESGSIKCEILINGKLHKTATSEGAYAGVTCGP